MEDLLAVDAAGWRAEIAAVGDYIEEYGDRVPEGLRAVQQRISDALKAAG